MAVYEPYLQNFANTIMLHIVQSIVGHKSTVIAARTPEVLGDILQYVSSCHFPSLLAALEADATQPKGAKFAYEEQRKALFCKCSRGLIIVVE